MSILLFPPNTTQGVGMFDSALACFEEGSLLERAGQESHSLLLGLLKTRDSTISGFVYALLEHLRSHYCQARRSLWLGFVA